MEMHTTIFEGVELDVYGDYEAEETDVNYKGVWKSCRIFHNLTEITHLLTEQKIEEIDEQIISEL